MINASDKTEPAGPSSPFPHIAPAISSTSLFSLEFGHATPRSHRLVNLCQPPLHRESPRCILRDDSFLSRDIDIEKKIFLASGEITFLSTRETRVSVDIGTDDAG